MTCNITSSELTTRKRQFNTLAFYPLSCYFCLCRKTLLSQSDTCSPSPALLSNSKFKLPAADDNHIQGSKSHLIHSKRCSGVHQWLRLYRQQVPTMDWGLYRVRGRHLLGRWLNRGHSCKSPRRWPGHMRSSRPI